jgi:hypothetical protein
MAEGQSVVPHGLCVVPQTHRGVNLAAITDPLVLFMALRLPDNDIATVIVHPSETGCILALSLFVIEMAPTVSCLGLDGLDLGPYEIKRIIEAAEKRTTRLYVSLGHNEPSRNNYRKAARVMVRNELVDISLTGGDYDAHDSRIRLYTMIFHLYAHERKAFYDILPPSYRSKKERYAAVHAAIRDNMLVQDLFPTDSNRLTPARRLTI